MPVKGSDIKKQLDKIIINLEKLEKTVNKTPESKYYNTRNVNNIKNIKKKFKI